VTYSRLLLVGLVATVAACRGQVSEEPPVHLIPDMDWQPKYDEQGSSAFFADGRAERPLVEGTVARGSFHEDEAVSTGKIGNAWVNKAPVTVDEKLIRRGEQRYNIYCTPCHDQTGAGNGTVVQRGFPRPVSLHENAPKYPDGQIFDIITHGIRNMPAYAAQVPVNDRWAIVAWLRVLQRSQRATLADVPADMKNSIEAPEVGK
jgi:mono/diheme cytochrome c family protein